MQNAEEKKKVIVLLSTYNGEKYVEAQIESILNQTYPNIEIYIRDDGSKDHTKDVLKKYETNERVHIEYGENVGFIKNFFWLVKNSGEAEYYAYADQDDVWFPKKIEMAMEKLEEEKTGDIPMLYFSNYDFYDGDLNFIAHNKVVQIKPSFQNALMDCMPLGFNTVFNKKTYEMMRANIPECSCGHDWWTYMVCAGMGKVVYDKRPTVKYRRHNNNVSAGGMSFLKFQVWRFKKFFKNHYFSNIHEQLKEYERLYGSKLNEEDRKILSLFTRDGYHFVNAMKKAFHSGKYRQRTIDELMVRVLCIVGKL